MSSASVPVSNSKAGRLALALVAVAASVGIVAALVVFLWPLSPDGSGGRFDAGAAESFQPGTLHYFESQHFYLVRQQDGSFLALYDWDAWAQGQYQRGDKIKDGCRVRVLPSDSEAYEGDLASIRQRSAAVQGLENTVLRSGCDGSAFDALGRRSFGPAAADLDRFAVRVEVNGDVIVYLGRRQCQERSPCLPYR